MSSEFSDFALSTLKGLRNAYTSDIDVFLLGTGGLLLGRKGLGMALFAYVAARRADQYVGVFVSQTNRIAQVMADGARD